MLQHYSAPHLISWCRNMEKRFFFWFSLVCLCCNLLAYRHDYTSATPIAGLIFGEQTSKFMTASHPMTVQRCQARDLFGILEAGESVLKYRQGILMLDRFPTNTTFSNPEGLGGCFAPWSVHQFKRPGRIPSR